MDVFIEKIVKKKKGPEDAAIITAIVLGGILALFGVAYIPFVSNFLPLLGLGIIYLGYYLITQRNIEYEYIVTNGDLDIDIIIAKRKRKRIFSATAKDFELVASCSSEHFNSEIKNAKNIIHTEGSKDLKDLYFISLNYKGNKTVVIFEPDEKVLNSLKACVPRKVFK